METGIFRIIGEGVVNAIDFNDKSAKLQFLTKKDTGGLQLFDVKVEGAKKEDLEKYVGKMVRLEDLKIAQVDFNKYYKIDDITKIKILGQGGQK